jgi:Leucine-rich repeat (LRR) protein
MEFGKLQSLVELHLSYCFQLACLPDSIVHLSQLKAFHLYLCRKLESLPLEFGKLQSLEELDLSHCSKLWCLPNSIVHLSQLKTFRLFNCDKLENLPMEFGKLQSLVKLDLSGCSQLGVYLIPLCTCHNSRYFLYPNATNWRTYHWSLGNFKAWWN